MNILRFLFLILTYVAQDAMASGLTLADYEAKKDALPTIAYITGVGQGLLYANAWLRLRNQPRICCQPDRLTLFPNNLISLIDTQIKRHSTDQPYPSMATVEVILLDALIVSFPCEK